MNNLLEKFIPFYRKFNTSKNDLQNIRENQGSNDEIEKAGRTVGFYGTVLILEAGLSVASIPLGIFGLIYSLT